MFYQLVLVILTLCFTLPSPPPFPCPFLLPPSPLPHCIPTGTHSTASLHHCSEPLPYFFRKSVPFPLHRLCLCPVYCLLPGCHARCSPCTPSLTLYAFRFPLSTLPYILLVSHLVAPLRTIFVFSLPSLSFNECCRPQQRAYHPRWLFYVLAQALRNA